MRCGVDALGKVVGCMSVLGVRVWDRSGQCVEERA